MLYDVLNQDRKCRYILIIVLSVCSIGFEVTEAWFHNICVSGHELISLKDIPWLLKQNLTDWKAPKQTLLKITEQHSFHLLLLY